MERPIYSMLNEAAGRVNCHMPGHHGESIFCTENLFRLDTTELPLTDDLYSPERGIAQAEKLYASAVGGAATIFLHNGSTSGIQAMVQLYCHEGDSILLARNAHMSAVNGCAVGGVCVEWIPMSMLAEGYCTVTEESVLSAMESHPECKAVLVTRPDFYGGCIRLDRIAALAKEKGMKLLVDEAHGAHLPWLGRAMEERGMKPLFSAGKIGADAWVQSVHKTLPGLTGSAVLNLACKGDYDFAIRILRRTMTSSPSFLLMMSIDDSRAFMEESGIESMENLIDMCDWLRGKLVSLGYGDSQKIWESSSIQFDPTRIVVSAPQGGKKLAEQLSSHGVDVEMWDNFRVVMIMSPNSDSTCFSKIFSAFSQIDNTALPIAVPAYLTELPPKQTEVRAACFGYAESVPLCMASGMVAAQSAGLYPPGIPLICPGEVYTGKIVSILSSALPQERFGTEGDNVLCINA